MWILEFAVVLLAIFFGARIGGIGIGFLGAVGVLALAILFKIPPGTLPIEVILIIMTVICAIAAMQAAGGLQYLVNITEKLLRNHPQQINFLAPTVTYFMTIFAGTGHTAFATLPVIAEVAKEQGIRPSRPLSIAVVASQIAITASPVSAAVIYMTGLMDAKGVGYLQLLGIWIPSTFIGCMLAALLCSKLGKELKDDPEYQARLAAGKITTASTNIKEVANTAKKSVVIFGIGVLAVILYATAISKNVAWIAKPIVSRDYAIMLIMLTTAGAIQLACRLTADNVVAASTFKQGMVAAICVLGVAWLGDTWVSYHINDIKALAGTLLQQYPWLLAVVLFLASMLLYSQAATARALMPTAVAMGVSIVALIGSFAAVSALFILPTYPTLLAAVQMDETGTTRIGKWVFNHPFIIPGTLAIFFSVILGFALAQLIL